MKVSELTGAQLDYWVARAEGKDAEVRSYEMAHGIVYYCNVMSSRGGVVVGNSPFRPSTDWAPGGPIIERERIELYAPCEAGSFADEWTANYEWGRPEGYRAPTPLTAAMRAYVASKFGDEVEVEGAKAGAERGGYED